MTTHATQIGFPTSASTQVVANFTHTDATDDRPFRNSEPSLDVALAKAATL